MNTYPTKYSRSACVEFVRTSSIVSAIRSEAGEDQTRLSQKRKESLLERKIDEMIICRAVERVVGGHLEGFDHKTVRNNHFVIQKDVGEIHIKNVR